MLLKAHVIVSGFFAVYHLEKCSMKSFGVIFIMSCLFSCILKFCSTNHLFIYNMIFQKYIGPDMFSWNWPKRAEERALPSVLLIIVVNNVC